MADDDLPAKITSASLLNTVKYVNVASITVLVWDYFLTLEGEVVHIWRSKWSVGKCFFLLSRYPTFFDVSLVLYYSLSPDIPISHCKPIYSVASWFTVFGIGMAEAILVLRTYALWGGRRSILIWLSVQYVSIYIAVVIILAFFLRSIKYGPPPLPVVPGCYPTDGSIILFADFVLLMLNETVIMILTLYIGIKSYRHSSNALVTTLYRDGIVYFVYLFLISGGNIIVLLAGPPEFVDLLNTFQRVMHSILSTRIILHVREKDRPRDDSAPTLTTLEFRETNRMLRRPRSRESGMSTTRVIPEDEAEGGVELQDLHPEL